MWLTSVLAYKLSLGCPFSERGDINFNMNFSQLNSSINLPVVNYESQRVGYAKYIDQFRLTVTRLIRGSVSLKLRAYSIY